MVILTIQFLQCIFKWRSVIYIHWVYSQIPIRLLPPYLNNIKLRLIIHGCLYTESVTVHNHFIAAFEFLSYCVSHRCIVERKQMHFCSLVLSFKHTCILTSMRSIAHTLLCPPTFSWTIGYNSFMWVAMLKWLCLSLWTYGDYRSVCTTRQNAQTCAVRQSQFPLLTVY